MRGLASACIILNLTSRYKEYPFISPCFTLLRASLHPGGKKFIAGGGRRGGSMALGAVKGGELGSDLKVYVFDYDTGRELECHKGHHGPVRCLRYHPEGTSYATGSEDGTIRIWKTDP